LDDATQELVAGIQEDCEAATLEVQVVDDLVIFSSGATAEAVVVTPDIGLCSGVVHAINTVLVPACEIKESDLTATAPSIAALENIDVEGAEPALGIGSLLEDASPITAPSINALPLDMAPTPAPGPGPALGIDEVDPLAPGPAGAATRGDLEITEGPVDGPAAAVPTDVPVAEGPAAVEPPTEGPVAVVPAVVDAPVADGPAAEPTTVTAEPTTETAEPPTVSAEPPSIPAPELAEFAREGLADVDAPGPATAFFSEAAGSGVVDALSPEAAAALAPEPGFGTLEDKVCIDLANLEVALNSLDASTTDISIKAFINFIASSDDLLAVLADPATTATVFIPIAQGVAYARENTDALATGENTNQLLKYHIIPGFNTAAAEFAATVPPEPIVADTLVDDTTCEETLQVDVPEAGAVEVNGVPVIESDLFSCDGRIVFHIIDGILLPQCGSEVLETARDVAAEEIAQDLTEGDVTLEELSGGPAEGPESEAPGVDLEDRGIPPGVEEPVAGPEITSSASIASMSIGAAVAVAVALLA
jgi:uncharacterized surface protein with fasciclin (FAS1) repeats